MFVSDARSFPKSISELLFISNVNTSIYQRWHSKMSRIWIRHLEKRAAANPLFGVFWMVRVTV